jgi:hypothetical protein
MAPCLAEFSPDFLLAKHFGALGMPFFTQNGGSPVSQSSIRLFKNGNLAMKKKMNSTRPS